MDRNLQFGLLQQQAQEWQTKWKGVSNQLMAVVVEHHEGEVEISVPVFEKICLTPLSWTPEVKGHKIRIRITDAHGQPAIEKDPRRIRLDPQQQDHCARALSGVVQWLQRTGMSWDAERQERFFADHPEWQVAISAIANLNVTDEPAPNLAVPPPEPPPEPRSERCPSCGWGFGEHRDGCEYVAAAQTAAAS